MLGETRYNIRSVKVMMKQIQIWIDQSTRTLDNEAAREYPNDGRTDALETRIEALQTAVEALEGIE